MEFNIKFDEKMIVETANKVLDEYEYNGKTIREWADLIVNPKTNADRIRSMSDEELAEWIVRKIDGYGFDGYEESVKAWLNWLREKVKV